MEEITLEKIDLIRTRTGASYQEAKEALEKHEGKVIDALIELEGQEAKKARWTDEFSVKSGEVVEKVKELLKEGNINRIRVKSDDKILVEFPVAVGALGALFLPQMAALGVMAALFKKCSIEVVRNEDTETAEEPVAEEKKEAAPEVKEEYNS